MAAVSPLFLTVPPDRASSAVAATLSEQGFVVRERDDVLDVERDAHAFGSSSVAPRVSFVVRVDAWAGGSVAHFADDGGSAVVFAAAHVARMRLAERGLIAESVEGSVDDDLTPPTEETDTGGAARDSTVSATVGAVGPTPVEVRVAHDEGVHVGDGAPSLSEDSSTVNARPGASMRPRAAEDDESVAVDAASPDDVRGRGALAVSDASALEKDPAVNAVAVLALVLGFIAPIGGIVAGAFALGTLRRTSERGRGVAVAGIVVGSALTVVMGAAIVAGVWGMAVDTRTVSSPVSVSASSPSASTTPTGSETPVPPFTLEPGQCFSQRGRGEISDATLVDCVAPHTYELYAAFSVAEAADDYPGDAEIAHRAEAGCVEAFSGFVGTAYDRSVLEYFYLSPTRKTWLVDDRRVSCFVTDPAGTVTGTLRGAAR
ncbi:DUF4190 domain-containing protein [Microbacterium proteolyticum]|uniref:DUF4190 domain-containing protein n=1 Tax=Microbacterium proteolyticum TaxID=1572644 RepID=UPI001FACB792|nr:DUF4190 domain-containing protein [Microbacterium proteolyticum]MCI9858838.1 septum formation family protein [Microbacterium proteolyticum]